jgi:hypothetical protein
MTTAGMARVRLYILMNGSSWFRRRRRTPAVGLAEVLEPIAQLPVELRVLLREQHIASAIT